MQHQREGMSIWDANDESAQLKHTFIYDNDCLLNISRDEDADEGFLGSMT